MVGRVRALWRTHSRGLHFESAPHPYPPYPPRHFAVGGKRPSADRIPPPASECERWAQTWFAIGHDARAGFLVAQAWIEGKAAATAGRSLRCPDGTAHGAARRVLGASGALRRQLRGRRRRQDALRHRDLAASREPRREAGLPDTRLWRVPQRAAAGRYSAHGSRGRGRSLAARKACPNDPGALARRGGEARRGARRERHRDG